MSFGVRRKSVSCQQVCLHARSDEYWFQDATFQPKSRRTSRSLWAQALAQMGPPSEPTPALPSDCHDNRHVFEEELEEEREEERGCPTTAPWLWLSDWAAIWQQDTFQRHLCHIRARAGYFVILFPREFCQGIYPSLHIPCLGSNSFHLKETWDPVFCVWITRPSTS